MSLNLFGVFLYKQRPFTGKAQHSTPPVAQHCRVHRGIRDHFYAWELPFTLYYTITSNISLHNAKQISALTQDSSSISEA